MAAVRLEGIAQGDFFIQGPWLFEIRGNRSEGGFLIEQKKFEALLILIVPRIVALILEHYPMDDGSASRSFYESGVYALLEQEDTKLWQLSPLTLFNMFDEEWKTGSITFPEG